ncbi:mannose-1-phosphate guanylyltransferase/mannose-6-phosphate isomerase [Methanocaldococcus infernus]
MKTIILAGGSGTRLFPLSRENYPKQFIKLKNFEKSLFQMTFERALKLCKEKDIIIVTNEKYKFLVKGQIEELGYNIDDENILSEPLGKNTLPAIFYAINSLEDEVVSIFPSDHLILDDDELINSIKRATPLTKNYIVTFGIKPSKPHTGYGYIKPGESLEIGYKVEEFKEKPDLERAKEYLNKGYLWNSGMFLFNTKVFKEEVKKHCPEVYEAFNKLNDINEIYKRVPDISIDYGVLEKSDKVAVVPLNINWSDLGSFDSIYDIAKKDKDGNALLSESFNINSKNNLVYSDVGNKLVSLIDIEDLIIVDTKDSLVICKKGSSEKIKEVFKSLKKKGDERVLNSLRVYRPWGFYEVLEVGERYKVKKICVYPGKRLSLQLHYHRSEHWVVVKGMAKVTVGEKELFVRPGESVFVKSGEKHRLENPGNIPLEVIEIQVGEYLEEDDIVRFDDDWRR